MVKIGIIGAGFAGLGTAYSLKDYENSEITIFESDSMAGGLSKGFKMPEWDWYIEELIHHWFANDNYIFKIINELGLGNELLIKPVKSSCYYNGKIAEIDSVTSLIKFPFFNLIDRFRAGLIMAWLKFDKKYLKYENKTSYDFLKKTMGRKVFEILWEPLFVGKFGKYADKINATWFWARIHPRTKKLGYLRGGIQLLINKIVEELKKNKVKLIFNSPVKKIEKKNEKIIINVKNKNYEFDYVIVTTPLPTFLKITKGLPKEYKNKLNDLKIISSQYFVLELERSFLEDGTYWLNVNEKGFPFMMIAEHTNFVNKKNYNNKHLIWIGKYLEKENKLWGLDKNKLLDKIIPYLKKINPKFEKSWIKRFFFNKYEYSQPIIETNYSKKRPRINTPIENLYIANMHHIYPNDRGINRAMILGDKIAREIKNKLSKTFLDKAL
jgi:protoporphyrinogen oxidase